MSTLKTDAIEAATGTNTDLDLAGKGTGVPDIAAGFKVGGTAGVPVNNLRTGTDGELITWDASGDPATVAVGTATHVLTSNGAGAAPTFQAAGGGGAWNYITTVTAAAAATVDFESQLSSTYGLYMISGVDVHPSVDEPYLHAVFGVGSTYQTGEIYTWVVNGYKFDLAWHDGENDGGTEMSLNGDTSGGDYTLGNLADEASAFNLYIPSPAGTTYNKTCSWNMTLGNGNNRISGAIGTGGYTDYASGTDAITSIRFLMSSGNISGTFRLYGLATS